MTNKESNTLHFMNKYLKKVIYNNLNLDFKFKYLLKKST